MFNFQKEVILNDVSKLVRIANETNEGGDIVVSDRMAKKMLVHGGGEYFGKYIVEGKVYRTLPVQAVNAIITLDPVELQKINSKHIQILIELGLDNDYRGDFGSALWYFRKPILVDLDPSLITADSLVKAFNTVIPVEYRFLEVKKNAGKVELTGADSYIKVRNVVITEYVCAERCEGISEEPSVVAKMSYDKAAAEYKIGDYGTVTLNSAEFGTYNYLLHNLRLPTYANLRFTSPAAPEMPMQGVNYVQYSFAYCVPRGINFGGMSVAGQMNHSVTLHTFFVPAEMGENGNFSGNSEFEAFLNKLDVTIVDMTRAGNHNITLLPDAYASIQDLTATASIAENKTAIANNTAADAEVKTQVSKNKAAIKSAHPDAVVD